MNDERVTQRLRFDWPMICKMACSAMIRGITLDQYVEMAMRDRMQSLETPARKGKK